MVTRITQGYSKLEEWIDYVHMHQMNHCITVLFSVACIFFLLETIINLLQSTNKYELRS